MVSNCTRRFLSIAFCLCVASLVVFGAVRFVRSMNFNQGCKVFLKRAADASSVEMAIEELDKGIDYAERNGLTEGIVSIVYRNPRNDVGFWYRNMVTARQELADLNLDAPSLEKSNVLMRIRESLMDGTKVTIPDGISIYPHNVAYFWWSLLSVLGIIVFALAEYLIDKYF